MRRVLVTGASGFIGRHSLPALRARGFDIHATGRAAPPNKDVAWYRADLMDRAQVARLLDEVRPTHLVHWAWYTVHGKFWTAPENLRWVEASLNLLREFAERGGQRALLAGTCAEYDWRFGYCSERVTPPAPASLYGACKHALHTIAAAYAAQVGLSLAWGRIFFPYGPDDRPERFVPSVIRSFLDRTPVRCSYGRKVRDFLHVQDIADAFAALLDSNVGGPVNIASGQPITIEAIINTIASLIPWGTTIPIEFGAVPSPPDDPPLLVADVRRLSDEVGWTPRHDLVSGLAEMVKSQKDR